MENDSIRDLRGGDFAWFHRSFLELGLGWKANLVYVGLVTFANGKNQKCFPSKGTLAKLLGVSSATVFRGLKILQDAGMIRIDVRKSGDNQLSNEYALLPTPMSVGHGGACLLDTPPMSVGHPNKKNFNKKKEEGGSGDRGVEFSRTYPKRVGDDDNELERAKSFRREANRIAYRFLGSISDAESWLLSQARAYSTSLYVRTSHPQYVPLARNWLLNKAYDNSPESWNVPAKRQRKDVGFEAERAQLLRVV